MKRDGWPELLGPLMGIALMFGPMVCEQLAHADGASVQAADPCPDGGYDQAAVVVVSEALPDGGATDVPATLCAGQRAPVNGVFLTVKQAAELHGKLVAERTANELLAAEVVKQDKIPGYVWLISCVGGVIVTGWCGNHDCNPLHLGRK